MMVSTRGCTAVSDNLTLCVGVRGGSCHGEVRVNFKTVLSCYLRKFANHILTCYWKKCMHQEYSLVQALWTTGDMANPQKCVKTNSWNSCEPEASGKLQSSDTDFYDRVLLELYRCRDTTGWQVSANSRITPPRCLEPHFDPSCLPRFLPDCPLRSWLIGARQEKGAFTSIHDWVGTL